jgi:hypothetical protein
MKKLSKIVKVVLSDETTAVVNFSYTGAENDALNEAFVEEITDFLVEELLVTDNNGNQVYVLDEKLCSIVEEEIGRLIDTDFNFNAYVCELLNN